MNKYKLLNYIIIIIFILINILILNKYESVINNNPCCSDCLNSCTDVYYDKDDGMCHHTIGSIFGENLYEPYEECLLQINDLG